MSFWETNDGYNFAYRLLEKFDEIIEQLKKQNELLAESNEQKVKGD